MIHSVNPSEPQRAPVQVLIIPYRVIDGVFEVSIFKRSGADSFWQFISGGANVGEPYEVAAKRELEEETAIEVKDQKLIRLQTTASIPSFNFVGKAIWVNDILVIPEICFAIEVDETDSVVISDEHSEYLWCDLTEAGARLKWDSNKTALWELAMLLK